MGFANELRDFGEGFSKGVDTGAKLQKIRRERPARASDIAGQPDPFGAGGGQITHTSGGDKTASIPAPSDGKVDNDTAQIAGRLKGDLMRDFKLSPVAANGIVASLASESGGFKQLQELAPTIPGTQGGWGYAQWTGPRRVAFAHYAEQNGLDPKSYDANYGFLKQELEGPEGKILDQLKDAKTTDEAINIFTGSAAEKRGYLRPGIPNMPGRLAWGKRLEDIEPFDDKTPLTTGAIPTERPAIETETAKKEAPAKTDQGGDQTALDETTSYRGAIPDQPEVQVAEQDPLNPSWQVAQVDDQQIQAGGQAPYRNQTAQPAVYAAKGGVLKFQDAGSVPIGNPAPTADPYSPTRGYTQPVPASPPSTFTPRRVGQPPPGQTSTTQSPLLNAQGRTPSQQAFFDARQARAAADAAAAAKPAANPLAGTPRPQAPRPQSYFMIQQPRGRQDATTVMMPNYTGNQRQQMTDYKNNLNAWLAANPGKYAEGGKVDFKQLLAEEQRRPTSPRDADSGISAHDRAALRYNLQTSGKHSYAYHDPDGYFTAKKTAKPVGKGGLPAKAPVPTPRPDTSPTGMTKSDQPIAEDRATRFRAGDVPWRETVAGPPDRPISTNRPSQPRFPVPPDRPISTNRPNYIQEMHQDVPSLTNTQPVDPDAQMTAIPNPDLAETPPDLASPGRPIIPNAVLEVDPNYRPIQYAQGGAIPDYGDAMAYARGGIAGEYESGDDTVTQGPPDASASSSDDTQPPEPSPSGRQPRPERQRYQQVSATPRLLQDVGQAIQGGVNYLGRVFGLGGDGGAIQSPESQQAANAGIQRFASGEGAATRDEINAIDDKVDPNRSLDEGHRQMVRLAKTMQYYQDQGRPDDAKASAASLLQYGAQRFGQLGTMAGAAYRQYQQSNDPKDLHNAVRFLEQAYDMIPDGAQMQVEVNDQTGKLEAYHTDAQGNEQKFEISPQELPMYIRKTMDNSMYWQNVLATADPTAAHEKQRQQYETQATQETRAYTQGEEERKHARDLAESKAQTEAANKEWERRHALERGESESDKLQAEAFKRADEEWRASHPNQSQPKIDMNVAGPALAKATEARKALDANPDDAQAQDNYNEAVSRLIDATGRDPSYVTNFGFDTQGKNFVYKTAKAAINPKDIPPDVRQAPDGKYYKKMPNGKFKEWIPETS